MNVCILRQTALDTLIKCIPDNMDSYVNSKSPWIEDFFHEHDIKVPLFNAEFEVPDFSLLKGNGSADDAENAIRLHTAFRDVINHVQATDARLWVALAHTTFYDYMTDRWPVQAADSGKVVTGTVTDRYFRKRGYTRNGIARLYWLAELTYDPDLEDPYEYTRYLFSKQDLINQVDSSLCRNKKILKASLKTLRAADPTSEQQKRFFFQRLNLKGGVTVLDALPEEELENLCQHVLDRVLMQKRIVNGSRVVLQSTESNASLAVIIRKGRPFTGKTQLRSIPDTLYRLTVGKEVKIGKTKYRIADIINP